PIAVNAERLAAQRMADADLPFAGLDRRHLLRDRAHRREDQAPGELGGRIGRRIGVLARRHDDAEPGAGIDVEMRIATALADQLPFWQPLQQRRPYLRALADQHQRFGVAQPLRQHVDVLDMIVPDGDVMSGELAEALEAAQRVEIIVEDRDLHDALPRLCARLLHRQQLDIEHQRRVRRNDAAGAARAVTERGWNDQRALATDLHGTDALVPAGDHLPLADLELERLVAVHGGIELLALLAVLVEPARIM